MSEIIKTNKGLFTVKIIINDKDYTINNEDIVDLYFIEDIYTFCIAGKISFYDKYGFVESLSFTGHEYISIIYGENQDKEIILKFYNIESINQMNDVKETSFTQINAFLVQPEYLNLMHKRYSKSWKNKKISDIIRDITKNMVLVNNFNEFEETKEVLPYFYMPYWTPAEAIRWLIERSSSYETGNAGYLYYFNTLGLNFLTIDKLFQNTTVEKDDNNNVIEYEFTNVTNDRNQNIILNWSISSIDYSSISNLRGSHMLGYNFENKKLLDKEFTYKDVISKYTMLGKKTLYHDISYSNDCFNNKGEDNENYLKNIYYNDFIKRYSKQFGIIMTVRGNERRFPGSMITIKWPSIDKENQIINTALDGKFLIKSVTNHFNANNEPTFTQRMVAIKNAYNDIEGNLLKASKYNTSIDNKKIGKVS